MTHRRLAYVLPAAVVAVVLAVLLVHMRGIPGQTRPHRDVGTQAQAVRQAFNAADGTVRIVALVSATCGACLRGAADLGAGAGPPSPGGFPGVRTVRHRRRRVVRSAPGSQRR
jgi:hypothetical protein